MRENKTSRSGFSARDDEHRDRDLRGARGGRDVPRSGAAEAPEGADRSSRGEGVIAGRNAVTEALRGGRPIDTLYVARGSLEKESLAALAAKARQAGANVKEADPKKLDALCGGAVHQGVVALAAAKEFATVDDMFRLAEERGEKPFLILADELADPHNLGAILRTAECAGAHGVIIPKRRSVGLTYTVGKASAGALEYMPVARVANLPACMEELKRRGVWIYGADMDGSPWCEADFTGPTALVIGSEGFGMGRLVKEKCDFIISLPMKGNITSLNASVACGVMAYEVARQRAGIRAR